MLGMLVSELPPEEGTTPVDKDKVRIWKAFGREPKRPPLERRDSVMKMTVDTINNFVRGFVILFSIEVINLFRTPFRQTATRGIQKSGGSFSLRSSQVLGTSCSFPKTPNFPTHETSFITVDRPTTEESQADTQSAPKKALHRTDPQTFFPIKVSYLLRNHLISKLSGRDFYFSCSSQ